MAECRICGASCSEAELRGPERGGGCANCKGSPDCRRCGHARREHRGTFGAGSSGCRVEIELYDGSLGVGRCACPGYSTDADIDAVGVTDVRVPKLRHPNQS